MVFDSGMLGELGPKSGKNTSAKSKYSARNLIEVFLAIKLDI